MTLNITLVMPSYIIQVSDRRMISVPSGKVYDDEANKGVVVKADDGIFSVIFSGIGNSVGKESIYGLGTICLKREFLSYPFAKLGA